MIKALESALSDVNKQLGSVESELNYNNKKILQLDKEIAELDKDLDITKQANQVLTNLVSVRIDSVKGSIEKIINEGLSIIFDEPITIAINQGVKRGKTEFSMSIQKYGFEGTQESFGGGVLSVIAFLLKVVTNLLSNKAKIQVFDESLTFVSVEYQERLSVFIRKLCEDLGYTIVLVSHQPVLSSMAHIKYKVSKNEQQTIYKLNKDIK